MDDSVLLVCFFKRLDLNFPGRADCAQGFPCSGRSRRWGVWQVGFIDGAFTCLIVGPSEPPPDNHRSIIGWLHLIASLPEGINEEGFFFPMLLTQQSLQSLRPPPTRIMFPCQRNEETRRWKLPSVESVAANVRDES